MAHINVFLTETVTNVWSPPPPPFLDYLYTPQQRIKRCMQLMSNGGFENTAVLLEKQAARLEGQARTRAETKAAAVEKARRAQVAQAEARQAASIAAVAASGGGIGIRNGVKNDYNCEDSGEDMLAAVSEAAIKAVEAAGAATEESEEAAATAASAASKVERWMGAESLAILLGGLVDYRVDLHSRTEVAKVVSRTCRAIMRQVSVLSEEELKKENQEVRAGNKFFVVMYYDSWMGVTIGRMRGGV